MTEPIWKQYFIPPFQADTYDPGIIWDSSPAMVASPTAEMEDNLDIDLVDTERAMTAVVAAMNAVCDGKEPDKDIPLGNPEYIGTHTNSIVKFTAFGGIAMSFCIRGWGHLTGAMQLSGEEAEIIQDEFGKFIVDCIKAASK